MALSNLEGIRDNPNPWGPSARSSRSSPRSTRSTRRFAQSKREYALLSIDTKIAEVEKAPDAAQAATACATAACCRSQTKGRWPPPVS